MKVAFISTPIRTSNARIDKNTTMPLGIMYLASYLEKLGHQVKIIDTARTRSIDITKKEIFDFKPELIGVSGIITAFKFTKTMVSELKSEFPDIPIVIGGHIVLDNYETLLLKTGCDYTITGYGEKPIAYLVEYLEEKRTIDSVPGLSYLKDKEIKHNQTWEFDNIDNIPYPAYHLIDMEYYVTVFENNPKLDVYLKKTGKSNKSNRIAIVIGARGCTDKCSFCVHEFEHKGFFVHSIDYVMGNIKILYESYGVRIFAIGEDLFLHNRKHAIEFVNAMNMNFPDAYFSCVSRADFIVKSGLVDIVKDSNCFAITFGFESGSNKMLKVLNKRTTRDINVAAYKAICETNITPAISFMVGTPGETKETIQETIDAIKEAGVVGGSVFITTPYPGSRLFKMCVERGIIKDIDAYLVKISDRDATKPSVNFTPYPDFILRMMQYMIYNAEENVRVKKDNAYKISLKNLVIHHLAASLLYKSYFLLRDLKNAKLT